MDNSAKILNAMVERGVIGPCVRLNRALDASVREAGATFRLELSFTYRSNGHTVGPIVSTQLIRETTFVEQLDSRWVRVRGRDVAIPSQPDPGSFIVASVIVTILDRKGNRIEQCDTETTIVQVPAR